MIENFSCSKAVAVLPGPRTSFLDHLIPLCHLFDIPLVCTDTWVLTCAETFYPETELILADEETFQEILSCYQTFVTVEPCKLHPKAFQFGEFLYRGEGKTVAGFHGNPEKFRHCYWIERYAYEDIVLTYGKHSSDYLEEKGVYSRLQQVFTLGNLREKFYHLHRPFFDQITSGYVFEKKSCKTIFFAPTWHFPEPQSFYFPILDSVPEPYQVLVKLHPFMYRLYPEWCINLKKRYSLHPSVKILEEIPLIYPFIQQVDIYLGDYSSVAYDFLSVDRPIFFLQENEMNWGISVEKITEVWNTLQREDRLGKERKRVYRDVYSACNWDFARK